MALSLPHRCLLLAASLALVGCVPLAHRTRDGGADPPPPPPPDAVALVLTPGDVLRTSVQGSGAGAALEQEARGQKGSRCLACPSRGKQSTLQAELQGHAADEARNQTAALALTAYYRLAESRAQLGLLQRGLEPVNALIAQADELKRKGLPVPDETAALRQQRGKAESDRVRLLLLGDRLSEQLHQFVGKAACLPPASITRITTIEVFHVEEEAIDEWPAVLVGLKYRPDLNLIRAALCHLDVGTLPVARQVMLGVSSLLSGPARRCVPFLECVPLLLPGLGRDEVEKVRRQLQSVLDERKRQAISEVRQAVRAVHAQQELIRLAREREALAQGQLDEAEERSRLKLGKSADLPLARRDLFKAQSDVVHEVIEWELARMNLRKAQGLLVRDAVRLAEEACPVRAAP